MTEDRCPACKTAFNTQGHKPLCSRVIWKKKKPFGWVLKRTGVPSAQEQKYSLVPKWRRRPGGRRGEMR